MSDDYDDYLDDDWQCCSESCLVVYRRGLTNAHCHQGNRDYGAVLEKARLLGISDSYMLVGPVDKTD